MGKAGKTVVKVFDLMFSVKFTTIGLFLFFLAIGGATIVEELWGTTAAKALIYKRGWFELLLLMLTLNMIYNIQRYNLVRKEKWTVLLFHVAFIIIMAGAAITRYISYEGTMTIREGAKSSVIFSAEPYFQFTANNGDKKVSFHSRKLYLNTLSDQHWLANLISSNYFEEEFTFPGDANTVKIEYDSFIPNFEYKLEKVDSEGKNVLELVTTSGKGRETVYLQEGEVKIIGEHQYAYNVPEAVNAVQFSSDFQEHVYVNSTFPVLFMQMSDQSRGVLKADSVQEFKQRRLHTFGNDQIVFKSFHTKSKVMLVSKGIKEDGPDMLRVKVTYGDEEKMVVLTGGEMFSPTGEFFRIGNIDFQMGFGAQTIDVPFEVELEDFRLERYAGSRDPSSFESDVVIHDAEKGITQKHNIFMNNVVDYRGYRLFQSSYDPDERGTILSVNHDLVGTIVSYIGYLLMALGFIFTLISKHTRYAFLRRELKKLREQRKKLINATGAAGVLLLISVNSLASEIPKTFIDEEHADRFGRVMVQHRSRVKPMHTLASELMRKVVKEQKLKINDSISLTPMQWFLELTIRAHDWKDHPMIALKGKSTEEFQRLLSTGQSKYASFMDFMDSVTFQSKLGIMYNEAFRKKPMGQSIFDKEVLKINERFNIYFMLVQHRFLNIYPIQDHPEGKWASPLEGVQDMNGTDSLMAIGFLSSIYTPAVLESLKTGDWEGADNTLNMLLEYQKKRTEGTSDVEMVEREIAYNKEAVFSSVWHQYYLYGSLLLLILIIQIILPLNWVKFDKVLLWLSWVMIVAIGYYFILHGMALIDRWGISGHAPWSNGYEALTFIAWATILAGFIFLKNSRMTMAASTILSAMTLMVAYMNNFDPEITQLVPVLKSYWLMIHVAIITASYGFLGLGSVMGIAVLLLYLVRTKKRSDQILLKIKEITVTSEMTMTVGLYMLTIGTFLGGVWANESWGRYWGWDAKETWALCTVLIYAVLVHLRLIPFFSRNYFAFNLLAIICYSSVIMTYFGVNFYLTGGLHSYAKGDRIPIHSSIPIAIVVLAIIAITAYIKKYYQDLGNLGDE